MEERKITEKEFDEAVKKVIPKCSMTLTISILKQLLPALRKQEVNK